MNRRTARACAMKLAYEWDMGGEGGETTLEGLLEVRPEEPEYRFMIELSQGVIKNAAQLDAEILNFLSDGWTFDRISRVDAAILRVAVYELKYTDTEAKFVINEAVELAKQFSADKSPAFINGVLGNLIRSIENA